MSSPVKFCAQARCAEVAIGAARSRDLCRKHYRSEILAKAGDLVRAEVLCEFGARGEDTGVVDTLTGQTITKGETVVLDPRETNIAALVAGGTVRVLVEAED